MTRKKGRKGTANTSSESHREQLSEGDLQLPIQGHGVGRGAGRGQNRGQALSLLGGSAISNPTSEQLLEDYPQIPIRGQGRGVGRGRNRDQASTSVGGSTISYPINAPGLPNRQKNLASELKENKESHVESLAKEIATSFKISNPSSKVISEDFPVQKHGTVGRKISLLANFFAVDIPDGSVYHYDIEINNYIEKNGKAIPPKPQIGPISGRKFPPEVCRNIINMLIHQFRDVFQDLYPAYDGYKNIITRRPLPISEDKTAIVTVTEDGRSKKYWVKLKPVKKESYDCEINLQPLHEAIKGKIVTFPQECIMALDIILRHGPALRYVPVGRSFFQKPRNQNEVPLGPGKEIWFGYHQSLRPGWKPLPKSTTFFLNIDKAATAFYTSQPLLKFVKDILHLETLPEIFNPFQIRQLKDKIKKIKIEVTHLPYPRKYTVETISVERASRLTFKLNDRDITIADYFLSQYNMKLKYPNFPCVVCGSNRMVKLPFEVCKIVDCQPARGKLDVKENEPDKMVKATAIKPVERFRDIKNRAYAVKNDNRDVCREFDIDISTDPYNLNGRVLNPPKVLYNGLNADVRDGQWEMRGKSFIKGVKIGFWAMLAFSCKCQPKNMELFSSKLIAAGKNSGMEFNRPLLISSENANDYNSLEKCLRKLKRDFPQLQLAVVVLRRRSDLYKELKKIAETDIGLITQCAVDANVEKIWDDKFSFRFLLNLCQKINTKMGGTNTGLNRDDKPSVFHRPIMIVGADVTHPKSDDREKFSIAAAVGSIDSFPSRYTVAVELQRNDTENKAREETILKLEKMMVKLITDFGNNTNGHLPETIIYYRDGISEGQFRSVRDAELIQIRNACSSIKAGYQPKITFVVVQKRHHTRFLPEDSREGVGRPGNVPAGTTVDTDITLSSHFNFYLCSHVAIQGTSRPCHYNVLYDDSDFSADELQKLTFYLCHTYSRCTKSISVPPPVMYADLAAFRAKLYIDSTVSRRSSSKASQASDSSDVFLSDEIINSISLQDSLKNAMYYI